MNEKKHIFLVMKSMLKFFKIGRKLFHIEREDRKTLKELDI